MTRIKIGRFGKEVAGNKQTQTQQIHAHIDADDVTALEIVLDSAQRKPFTTEGVYKNLFHRAVGNGSVHSALLLARKLVDNNFFIEPTNSTWQNALQGAAKRGYTEIFEEFSSVRGVGSLALLEAVKADQEKTAMKIIANLSLDDLQNADVQKALKTCMSKTWFDPGDRDGIGQAAYAYVFSYAAMNWDPEDVIPFARKLKRQDLEDMPKILLDALKKLVSDPEYSDVFKELVFIPQPYKLLNEAISANNIKGARSIFAYMNENEFHNEDLALKAMYNMQWTKDRAWHHLRKDIAFEVVRVKNQSKWEQMNDNEKSKEVEAVLRESENWRERKRAQSAVVPDTSELVPV